MVMVLLENLFDVDSVVGDHGDLPSTSSFFPFVNPFIFNSIFKYLGFLFPNPSLKKKHLFWTDQ
jgi:hypothetical protein